MNPKPLFLIIILVLAVGIVLADYYIDVKINHAIELRDGISSSDNINIESKIELKEELKINEEINIERME